MAKRNPGNVDSTGRTLEQEREAGRRVHDKHQAGTVNLELRATVGRFWHSARRWHWGFRFHEAGVSGTLDLGQGVRFEVVEQL